MKDLLFSFLQRVFQSPKLQLLIILSLTSIAYSNIFQNTFSGDDINLILNWDFIRHVENIPAALTSNVIPEPYSRFRPLGTPLLIIYYQMFGANPLGYHFHSILAFFIDVVLVYFITWEIVARVKGEGVRGKEWIPVITALIFALHPLHSESVTEILVSIDGTGYIFFFASFYYYLKASQSKSDSRFMIHDSRFKISLILAAGAFFSYEITLILPLMIVLYDYCFKFKSLKFLKSLKTLKVYLPYFALAGGYLIIKSALIHKAAQASYLADSFYLTMLTMTHVFMKYIGLLIWPLDLSKNHEILPGVQVWIDPFTNMQSITSQSIFDVNVLGALGILGGLGWLGFKFRKKFPLVTFAIGWFFISLLPVSYIFPQDTLMQERYMFLGVYSFGLLFSLAIIKISEHISGYFLAAALVLITSLYMYRIYLRNFDFRNQIAVYQKTVDQNPDHIISNFMLASAYQEQGNDQKAIFYYLKTLKLEPNIPNVYLRLGEIYQKHGQLDEAAKYYQAVLSLTPNDAFTKDKLSEINQLKKAK